MKFDILISPAAADDVERLEAWLLDKNPAAAMKVGMVLEDAIASLAELPERGRARTSRTRELERSIYLIRYRIHDRPLVVTGILHGREQRQALGGRRVHRQGRDP